MPIAAPAETSESRYLFGIAAADLAVRASVIDGNLEAIDGTMRAWATESGSTRLDDLLDVNGQPIVETRSVMGQYRFYGPPGVTALWVDADGGPRGMLVATQALADAATYADDARAAAEVAQEAAEQAEVMGMPPIAYDTDGTPYLTDRVGAPGSTIAYDTDGTPYLIGA